jgi:taurine dioxygenase
MARMATDFIAAIGDPARVRRLEPFGVEIAVDMSRPFDRRGAEAFRELFFRETWLLFRNQHLAMDDQIRLIGHLGTVLPDFGAGYLDPEDKVLGSAPLDYHSDMSASPLPMDVISLLAVDLDEAAGSWTGFVSGKRAWERMEPALREELERIEVTFVQTFADRSQLSYDIPDGAYRLTRPAVIDHRITGERMLFVPESASARVEGLDREASRAMLDRIFAHVRAPDNEMRHVWRQGDLLIWDNIAIQHCRPALDPRYHRRMQRVGAAEKTLREQYPEWNYGAFFGEERGPAEIDGSPVTPP